MSFIIIYAKPILDGIGMTLYSWLIAGSASLLVGTLLGMFNSKYVKIRWLKLLIKFYIFIAKGIPAFVQILMAYFLLPRLLGISIPGLAAALMALSFCSSGYVAEIVRAGINALPVGQWEAAMALGYSFNQRMSMIILPQAIRNVIPALIGELEQLLKSTSLLATIGITELTRTGMNIISRDLNPIPVYLSIAVIYLIFSGMINIVSYYIFRVNPQSHHAL